MTGREEHIVRARRSSALRFIVCLGIVSLFADMTYEGAHSIIGPFLRDLGASPFAVALIAGAGEMLAASLRFFSGRFADRTQAYWTITFAGYAMNVVAVPALAFVPTWQAAAILVVAERTGKALRGPARDVLLSGATEDVGHGWGFGLHSIMDQTGAVIGPLLMVAAVARSHHFGPGFLWLAFPALGTLLALTSARILNPERSRVVVKTPGPQVLPRVFLLYIAAAALLACGMVDFPLLAYWHYGLGKGVAFTSDARSSEDRLFWDRDWARSEMYGKFWEQILDWSLRPVESKQDLNDLLSKLIAKFESYEGTGYDFTRIDETYKSGLMAGIIGFEMDIELLEGKFKLGQDRSPADRQSLLKKLGGAKPPRSLVEFTRSFYERQSKA